MEMERIEIEIEMNKTKVLTNKTALENIIELNEKFTLVKLNFGILGYPGHFPKPEANTPLIIANTPQHRRQLFTDNMLTMKPLTLWSLCAWIETWHQKITFFYTSNSSQFECTEIQSMQKKQSQSNWQRFVFVRAYMTQLCVWLEFIESVPHAYATGIDDDVDDNVNLIA